MRQLSVREQFARDTVLLFKFIQDKGYGWTYGEAHRTELQQEIYREGWKIDNGTWIKDASLVRSKVAESQHQKRMAIDLHIWSIANASEYITDAEWKEIGTYWKSLDPLNRWGGDFGVSGTSNKIGWDRFHFERQS